MNFCSNCGAEVKEGQAICLSCGFALKSSVKPKSESVASDLELSDRVEHNVFKFWPEFSDGPVGRMNYFMSWLKLIGVGIGIVIVLSIAGAFVEQVPMMSIVFAILAIAGLIGLLSIAVHQIALVYKRFWDMGFDEQGARIGMTIGFYVISMIPLLNLATLAIFFIPGKRK